MLIVGVIEKFLLRRKKNLHRAITPSVTPSTALWWGCETWRGRTGARGAIFGG